MADTKPLEKLSFEDALQELEGIVKKLETGEAPLEDSIKSYERGVALKKHCESKLRDAELKIEKINVEPDGSLSTSPLDQDSDNT